MIRLHLVGFTTDLKNLIFARRKGAKSGSFVVEISPRLRTTLEEVARLEDEARKKPKEPEPKRESSLSPKEIQNLLRRGKTTEEVAKVAGTEVAWIERFTDPILEERGGVVDAVKSAWISKARLGKSGMSVGDSIEANLRQRRVSLPPEILDEGWKVVKRNGRWEVSFNYLSRGQGRKATFSYYSDSREVRATNELARELAWRPPGGTVDESRERPARRRRPTSRKTKAKPRKPATRRSTSTRAKPRGGSRRTTR